MHFVERMDDAAVPAVPAVSGVPITAAVAPSTTTTAVATVAAANAVAPAIATARAVAAAALAAAALAAAAASAALASPVPSAAGVHRRWCVLHERGRGAGVSVQRNREHRVRGVLRRRRFAASGRKRFLRGADVFFLKPGASGLAVYVLARVVAHTRFIISVLIQ